MSHESEATEYKVNRANFHRGEWDGEPDRVEWRSPTGFPCLIVRNNMGALCGYVGLPPGHPQHGADYNNVDGVDVHGGLTYSDRCSGHICHVAQPGEPDAVWWLGFDCAHLFDVWPLYGDDHEAEYRNIAYVTAEVERLAAQLAGTLHGA